MPYARSVKAAPVKAITGTIAVALLLAFTRWGSYIGFAPLFLTDVLIALAVVDRMVGNTVSGPRPLKEGHRSTPGLLLSLFIGFVALRGLMSVEHIFTMDWIRDLVPFLYIALAFASASALARADNREQLKTVKCLWWALLAHLFWVAFVVFSGINTGSLPSFPRAAVPILTLRPDVDVAVLGITAGLLVRRILLGHRRKTSLLLLALTLAAVTQFATRAGLISVALCMVAALVITYSSLPKGAATRTMVVLLFPVLLTVGLAGLAQTTAGERLVASTLGLGGSAAHEVSAQGTQRAREMSWEGIIDWTMEDPVRALVGSGFGNNFLDQSGVLQFLQGTDYEGVRSPHNWLVGVFARTGIVGVTLATSVLLVLVRSVVRARRSIGGNELLMVASLIVLAFIPIALLGVVLESPFGAVPFWWAAGIVLSLRGVAKADGLRPVAKLPMRPTASTPRRRPGTRLGT